MSERPDLSIVEWSEQHKFYIHKSYLGFRKTKHTPKSVLSEALRAQASEDALRERVRVLEEALQKDRKLFCRLSWEFNDDKWGGALGARVGAIDAIGGGKEQG